MTPREQFGGASLLRTVADSAVAPLTTLPLQPSKSWTPATTAVADPAADVEEWDFRSAQKNKKIVLEYK